MNKFYMIVLFMVFVFFSILASTYGEEIEPLSFTDVVNVNSVDSNELYMRAKLWFANSFADSKNVLEVEDKNAGILVGKGEFAYEPNVFMASSLTRGRIKFMVKIIVKNERYKYSFSDFVHQGSHSSASSPIDFGLITTAEVSPVIQGTSKGMRKKLWSHMQNVSILKTAEFITSLKAVMVSPVGGNEDW